MNSPADDITLLSVAALSLRLMIALGLGWAATLVAMMVVQRSEGSDSRLQRSWFLTGAVIAGICLWAAALSAAAALDGSGAVSLPFAVLALLLAPAIAGMSLQATASSRRSRRYLWTGGGAIGLLAEVAIWAQAFGWRTPAVVVLGSAVAAAAAQALTVWTLVRWRRRDRPTLCRRSALVALAPAAVGLLPLAIAGLALPFPASPSTDGPELLCALLAATMAALALQAARMERDLLGKHQMLGAQLKQANAHLQRTPLADPLTGLLSRLGIETALRKAALAAEAQGQRIALLAIGLDGFRSVNDSFGHALGDSVLREVARRLSDETSGHHLARLGGDEFVLMLQGQVDRQGLGRVAGRLLELLDGPLTCDGHELTLSASIGIACFPEDGGASKLLARANAAMHAAKEAGGSTYMTFEPRMQDDARDRHELLRDLRHAIENKQLELFYQPKIDARSGQVTAAEALLRWHHPIRGTLSPDVFIPLAERHGLIGALGNWVIEDACRQARVWRERGLKMRMAINLSVFQMRQNDLVERIQASLKRHGVNPQRLTCEITESVAMEDTQVTQRTFERLGQAGIHLSIDDFGTGYSSLGYLRRLPATELKIDRSFVMDLDTSADARAIVDAVLKLAHAIGLKVVAEGVENIRQRDILLELGCDEFQGYLFARPMSARALLLWAVDDKPAKNAFRPSLFAETDLSSEGPRSSQQASIHPLPLRRRRGAAPSGA
ncbi:MAG TPA: bifunctional diguanylate cyclase/phosphodiesterase [Albitalea sp.]|uniref:putative bifunctional diguanylate cyclase/phosphodiesterase n=1 Tax=Piscinibacter sp. TaxID=1903157 RepID=UPI002ED6011D